MKLKSAIFASRAGRHSCRHPRHRAAVSAASVAALVAGLAASGSAPALTITGTRVLESSLLLDESEQLTVNAGARLIAPVTTSGISIRLAGGLQNNGRISVAFGSEDYGFHINGPGSLNSATGTIESHLLVIGTTLRNDGLIETGIFRPIAGPFENQRVTIWADALGSVISSGAVVANGDPLGAATGARWDHYAHARVEGAVRNSGAMTMGRQADRNTGTGRPAIIPFQVMSRHSRPARGLVENMGEMYFLAGTVLLNDGEFRNSVSLPFAGPRGGKLFFEADSQFENRTTFGSAGEERALFVNDGRGWVVFQETRGVNSADMRNVGAGSLIEMNGGTSFLNDVTGKFYNDGGTLNISASNLSPSTFRNAGWFYNEGGAVNLSGHSFWFEDANLMNRGSFHVKDASEFELSATGNVTHAGLWEMGDRAAVRLRGGNFSAVAGSITTLRGETLLRVHGTDGATASFGTVDDLLPGTSAQMSFEARSTVEVGGDVGSAGLLLIGGPGSSWDHAGSMTIGARGTVEHSGQAVFTNRGLVSIGRDGAWKDTGVDVGQRIDNAQLARFELNGGNIEGGDRLVFVNDGDVHLRDGASLAVRQFQLRDGMLDVGVGTTLTTAPDPIDGRLLMTGGRLMGRGTINGDVFGVGSAPADPFVTSCPSPAPGTVACFTPGSSPGTMTINGDLTMGFGTVTELEIARDAHGELVWDQVIAHSMSFVDGALIRVLIAEDAPGANLASLQLLECTVCDFSGAEFQVLGGLGGEVTLGEGGLIFAMAPVPEPATWGLMLLGVAAVGVRIRCAGAGQR
jgi:hypothetical protein